MVSLQEHHQFRAWMGGVTWTWRTHGEQDWASIGMRIHSKSEGVPHFGLNVISLPCVLGGLLSPSSSKSGWRHKGYHIGVLHQGNLAHMSNFSYFIFANIFWKKLSEHQWRVGVAWSRFASECEWGAAATVWGARWCCVMCSEWPQSGGCCNFRHNASYWHC